MVHRKIEHIHAGFTTAGQPIFCCNNIVIVSASKFNKKKQKYEKIGSTIE
jgi:hypothetical protein